MPDGQPEKSGAQAASDRIPQDGDSFQLICKPQSFNIANLRRLYWRWPWQKQYAVHEDILKQSPVLGRMCVGNTKEACERLIALPDDDPARVGILVEYLYTHDFWASTDPQAGIPKQESATTLAHLYIFADKYVLEDMKVAVTKKITKYTDVEAVDDWLAVAEIIYAATPGTDSAYPESLRSLVVYSFMESERAKRKNGCPDALQKRMEKGGRLTIDIYRASRIDAAKREEKWFYALRQTGRWLSLLIEKHDEEHDGRDDCMSRRYTDFPSQVDLQEWHVSGSQSYDKNAIIGEANWQRHYKIGGG
ncbi:MAG: hypothetical protein Q9170_004350 [Blastenia crenularia]